MQFLKCSEKAVTIYASPLLNRTFIFYGKGSRYNIVSSDYQRFNKVSDSEFDKQLGYNQRYKNYLALPFSRN